MRLIYFAEDAKKYHREILIKMKNEFIQNRMEVVRFHHGHCTWLYKWRLTIDADKHHIRNR